MFKRLFLVGGSIASSILIAINVNDIPGSVKTALSLCHDPLKISKKWDNEWDLDCVDGQSKKSKATRHLILIRHGQYIYDTDDLRCKLTSLGRQQADATGKRLLEIGYNYDEMIHSTMTRATETATIISKHIPEVKVKEDSLLEEGCPFINEPPLPHWNVPSDVIKVEHQRIETAFKNYFHRAPSNQVNDSYTILVCHANVIRYMICRALQFPPEGWIRLSLDHASISWVSIKPDGVVIVRSIGNSGFMPPDIITSS